MVNLKDSTVFDYIRYVGSFALFVFSTVVTVYAILQQKTSFWQAWPTWWPMHMGNWAWLEISDKNVGCTRYEILSHHSGYTRLGCSAHLHTCPLPHRGDGGHTGAIWPSCLHSWERTTQIALVELKLQDPATYRLIQLLVQLANWKDNIILYKIPVQANSHHRLTHPKAYRLGQAAARGDNIERFLMGRQVFFIF